MLLLLLTSLVAGPAVQAQTPLPPLAVEISAEHPLFVFQDGNTTLLPPAGYAAAVVGHWAQIPESVRPYSMMLVSPAGIADFRELLSPFQQAGVPVCLRVTDDGGAPLVPLAAVREMLDAFPIVRGVEARGLAFDGYDPALADDAGVQPDAARLAAMIRLAAGYGRFVMVSLEGMAAPRMLANANTAALYATIVEHRDHVLPVCLQRGPNVVPAMGALMGLWLAGAAANWGVAPDARWYADARFREPGIFGPETSPDQMPVSLYRAMILNGAMTGASVYLFPWERSLWHGGMPQAWTQAILPTLQQIVEGGFIARRDFVAKRAPAAMQLSPADTPSAFETNARHLDAAFHEGLLIHGVYGAERPGQIPELILNRGDRFWVPVLPAHAPPGVASGFAFVARPESVSSAEQWAEALGRYHPLEAAGQAAVTRSGRGVFVMNTRENAVERQTFFVPDLPAPIRGVSARREGGVVTLSWGFRGGDVAYNVYRRMPPETHFTLAAKGLDQRQFTDTQPPPDQAVAYAVTALTGEKEPLEGEVGYGEYLVFSTVESRIAEEALLTPLMAVAEGAPLPGFGEETARIQPPIPPLEGAAPSIPWWPYYGGLDEAQRAVAAEIVARTEAWDAAVAAASLEGVADLYAEDYRDGSGWGLEYAVRAWQFFFERFTGHRMHRQIRLWDFSAHELEGRVSVRLYALFTAGSVSDESGLRAGKPVLFPRDATAETWVTWAKRGDVWRIVETRPALPNFRDLAAMGASPEILPPGPDRYPAEPPPPATP